MSELPTGLVYGKDHPSAGQTVEPEGIYIFSYDVKAYEVADYKSFPEDTDVAVFKSALINTIDAFVASYCQTVLRIASACEASKKALGAHIPVSLDYNAAMGLMQRAQAQFDQAAAKIASWDGMGKISFILPFAEIAFLDEELTKIDTKESKPYLLGIMFTASFNNINV